jgi:hypothetical protein
MSAADHKLMKDITQVFGNYAKENLTKIDQENTVRAVEELGFNVQKDILNSLFQKYDAAGIGSIYIHTFLDMVCEIAGEKYDKFVGLFGIFDTKDVGYIEAEQFLYIIEKANISPIPPPIQPVFIDYHHFIRFFLAKNNDVDITEIVGRCSHHEFFPEVDPDSIVVDNLNRSMNSDDLATLLSDEMISCNVFSTYLTILKGQKGVIVFQLVTLPTSRIFERDIDENDSRWIIPFLTLKNYYIFIELDWKKVLFIIYDFGERLEKEQYDNICVIVKELTKHHLITKKAPSIYVNNPSLDLADGSVITLLGIEARNENKGFNFCQKDCKSARKLIAMKLTK